MTGFEKRAVLSLAFLYSSRMLGLFMVLPVFILYGKELSGANEMMIGLAIGAYGLSQAIFQVPFGALSDRLGRKPLIFAGLVLFFAGSVLAAASDSIEGVIIGRFLQGAGAIASVLMALLSDLTSEDSRTKSMAMVGMSIGLSFSLALVLGPVIAQWQGLSGIFWLTAILALVGIFWLFTVVPSPVQHFKSRDTRLFKDQMSEVLRNPELFRLNVGIFALHLCLTAMFVAVPFGLVEKADLPASEHWLVYLSVMLTSFIAMVPLIIVGEKRRKMKAVFLFAIGLLALAALSVPWSQTRLELFWLSLFFFFMAFNLLEASLPSLVSKLSPAGSKGTAMGVYSTAQFLGAFVGGVCGGWLLGQAGLDVVYMFVAAICLLWLIIALPMVNPNPETGMTLTFQRAYGADVAEALSRELSSVEGVEEVVAIPGEKLAYLKVIRQQLDEETLNAVHQRFDP